MLSERTITQVLIDAFKARNVDHVFGIPGDYVLSVFSEFESSNIEMINTCDEQGAGFAADAYARVRGLAAVCVTYGVGGLKLVNTTAQAYAEHSPVVIISGAPGVGESESDALLHHCVGDLETQLRIFREVTVAQAILNDAATARQEIERVLSAASHYKRPVYIEIPRDTANTPVSTISIPRHEMSSTHSRVVDQGALNECLGEVMSMVNAAKNPVFLVGAEVHRFGLQSRVAELIEKSGIPFATTIMGKSVLSETKPGFLGVYAGALSKDETVATVEGSDCLINLGAMLSDVNTGIFTAVLKKEAMVESHADLLEVKCHQYRGVGLGIFVDSLCDAPFRKRAQLSPSCYGQIVKFAARKDSAITIKRLFECLDSTLSENTSLSLCVDVGDALFAAIDLTLSSKTGFISCAYYASLGFSVPACIAVQLAKPSCRPVVLVGDGAFQMTGLELTTVVRYELSPIVVVLDNSGFGTERPMSDGLFNDVHPWDISLIPKLIGSGKSYLVRSEEDLVTSFTCALENPKKLAVLHVEIAKNDMSRALSRLTAGLGERVATRPNSHNVPANTKSIRPS